MNIARISSSLGVTIGNSIPTNAWVNVTASVVNVTVASTQALFIIRVNDDGFWGFLYTPREDSSFGVYQGSAYCLFTKPTNFTTLGMGIVGYSPVFSDPVFFINGIDALAAGGTNAATMSYFKFDIRPYFSQSN